MKVSDIYRKILMNVLVFNMLLANFGFKTIVADDDIETNNEAAIIEDNSQDTNSTQVSVENNDDSNESDNEPVVNVDSQNNDVFNNNNNAADDKKEENSNDVASDGSIESGTVSDDVTPEPADNRPADENINDNNTIEQENSDPTVGNDQPDGSEQNTNDQENESGPSIPDQNNPEPGSQPSDITDDAANDDNYTLIDNTDDNTAASDDGKETDSISYVYELGSIFVELDTDTSYSLKQLLKSCVENDGSYNFDEYIRQLVSVRSDKKDLVQISISESGNDYTIALSGQSEEPVIITMVNVDETVSLLVIGFKKTEVKEEKTETEDDNVEIISEDESDTEEEYIDPSLGFDNGEEYDAMYYPSSPYNPYPGSLYSNCTYAVWHLVNNELGIYMPAWGNAGSWFRRAAKSGYPTGDTPRAHSIMVSENHVVYIKEIDENGRLYIQEGNIKGKYRESWWTPSDTRYSKKVLGYIYLDEFLEPKTLTATDDKTYKVTLTYDYRAAIPGNAVLEVKPIEEDDGDYNKYADIATEKLEKERSDFGLIKAFDITIKDPETGEEIEPASDVIVAIELLEISIKDDDEFNVLHIEEIENKEDQTEEQPSDDSQPEPLEENEHKVENIECETNDESVVFNTDSFSVYVILRTVKELVLTASDGNNYKITVSYDDTSGIPENAILAVFELNEQNSDFLEYMDKTLEAMNKKVHDFQFIHVFDISLIDPETGEHYQPNKDVKVSIELFNEEIHDTGCIDVAHFTGLLEEEPELLKGKVVEGKMEFNSDSFSAFVVAYTVNFHWGEYTYNLEGGNGILLSTLLNTLGTSIADSMPKDSEELLELAGDMDRIENVEFSNPALMQIESKSSEQAENDWLLTSLVAFDTEEVLTITLTDGDKIVIRVTDEATDPIARVSNDNGTTWTEFDYLVTTGDTQGAFDYVKTLSGNVVVELLKETDERYTLTSGISIGDGTNTFNGPANPKIKNLTIRGADPSSPTALVKNHTSSMFKINIRSCNTTFENLIIDGAGITNTSNGSIFQFATNENGSGNNGGGPTTATVRNVGFIDCSVLSSTYVGGAIYSASPLTIDNCSFDDCSSNGNGGAVYGSNSVTVVNGSTFKDCYSSKGDGGAIFGGSIRLDNNTETVLFDTCHAANDGGALRSATITMDNNTGDITFKDCYTTNENGEGGAAQTSSVFRAVNNQGNILFTGCYTLGRTAEGGALFATAGQITLKSAGDGTIRFENLTANASDGGGAICGWSSTIVTVEGTAEHPVEFENCVAKNSSSNRGGGAVYVNSGSGNLKYVNVNNCHASYGGAFSATTNLTLTNCNITDCTTNESGNLITNGGAVNVYGGTTTLNNCTITGCKAKTGGAIYIDSGTVVMNDGSATNCEAEKGAGVYVNSGTFTLNGGVITDNNATNATSGATVQTKGGNGTLRFKGAAKVKDNTVNDTPGRNVYLDSDRASAIYADGLSSDAEIYIFVTDGVKGKRSYSGRTFGYCTDDSNLDRIINESTTFTGPNGEALRGEAFTDFGGGKLIAWKGEDTVLTVVSSVDGTPVGKGARFELRRGKWDGNCVIWRGTTDENGQIHITWTTDEQELTGDADGGGASFINVRDYTLRQIKAADGYALPGGSWDIDITDALNGIKVSATKQVSQTNYTQPFAISGTNLERNAWTIKNDPDTMVVVYNLNDGDAGASFSEVNPQVVSFSNTESTVATDSIYTTEPVWDGHKFLGWNTKQDGLNGVVYPKDTPLYRTSNEDPRGTLTLYAQWEEGDPIARVSFNGGTTWTPYYALITGDYEKLDGSGLTEHVEGAFDAAKTRIMNSSGTVIIETLCETHPRYTLDTSFEFTNGDKNSTTLIIRTMPSLGFRSRIVKNQTAGPIIHSSIRYNTLKLENLIFDGNNLVSDGTGGAIRQSNTSSGGGVFLTNCDFIDCKAASAGGAVYVAINSLTIKNTTNGQTGFFDCTSGENGGAVYSQPNVTVENTADGSIVFQNCEAGTSGGAIYTPVNATLNGTGQGSIIFDACKANGGNGGAISAVLFYANENKGEITFNQCEAATDGGAIYTNSSSTPSMNNNVGTIQFLDCKAKGGNGGAIRFQRAFDSTNNAGMIRFERCSATGNGGAISNTGSYYMTFTNTGRGTFSFAGCYAKANGGAIYLGGALTITGVNSGKPITFVNCKAGWDGTTAVSGGNGGAIYSGSANLTNVIFGVKGDPSKTCTASATGGAVYSGALNYNNASSAEIGFYFCEAGTSGGAINSSGTVTLNNTNRGAMTFETCKANGGSGGSIYTATFTANSNNGEITFNKCEATVEGGAVYTTSSSTSTMDNNAGTIQFLDCKAKGGNGGAIRAQRSFNATNNAGTIRFERCSATGNGGALSNTGYSFSLTNTGNGMLSFTDCYAKGNGGAIFANRSSLTLTGAKVDKPITFENCKAGWDGTTTVSGGNGGAIYSGSANLTNVIFGVKGDPSKACTASAAGGAVDSTDLSYKNSYSAEIGFYYCSAGTSGGAINSTGTVTLSNTGSGAMIFETCKANGGNGGAIRAGLFSADENKGEITFNKCEATAEGGAVFSDSSSTSSMDNNKGTIQFLDCKAKGGNGGAIRFQRAFNATDNAGTIRFERCSATGNGGALSNTGYSFSLTNTGNGMLSFTDCYAKGNGGAVYANGGSLTLTGAKVDKPITFENCKAGWDGMTAVTGKNGGGTYSGATNLTNVTFGVEGDTSKACSASGNGGAVYAGTGGTLNQVSVFGCSAGGIGAAVYIPSGNTTTFKGGRYTGNTASGTNGGAINTDTDNNSGSHFDFEGSIYIYDNNVDASGNQRNVVLSVENRDEPIHTTGVGLSADAKIGVYVIGNETTNPYMSHGQADQPFGRFGNASNLNRFINDRDTKLLGNAGTGTNICWGGNGIVKITDMNDNLLCKNIYGSPAVYGTIKAGLDAVKNGPFYNNDGVGYSGAVKLKLLQDIDLSETSLVYDGSREMTITTAELPDDCTDGYPYVRNQENDPDYMDPYADYREEGWAYIKRVQNSTYLIQIYNSSAKVHVEHLLIDGANISVTATGSSGFHIRSASFAEFRDMAFINMKGASGAAITAGGYAVRINASNGKTIKFYNCYASGDGGAISGTNLDIGGTGNGRIIFDSCSASSTGGAIRTGGSSKINNSDFYDCKSPNGGAIYIAGTDGYVCTITNSTFDGHEALAPDTANSSNGGAIYVLNGSMKIDGCSFADFTVSGAGGVVYFDAGGSDSLTINNSTFVGRETLANQPNALNNGGAVRINANSGIAITNSSFTDFYVSSADGVGGAIWSEDQITKLDGVVFNGHVKLDNSIKNAKSGGAIYANSNITINNSEDGVSSFNNCSATNGGAIYANADMTIQNGSGMSSFTDCNAGTGGAIYANSNITINGTNAESTVFENCHSTEGAGGTIRINTAGKAMNIANARFGAIDENGNVIADKGCFAATGGGAVYYAGWNNSASNSFLKGCQFYGCEAANNGGAFWMNANPANLTVSDCIFKGCSANGTGDNGRGGAVYLAAGRTIAFTNTTVEECFANTDGGAIYGIAETGTNSITLNNCQITGNTANNRGSAIYSKAFLTVKGNTRIAGNQAFGTAADTNNDGVIDTAAGAINLASKKAVTFEGNVYVYDNVDVNNKPCNVVLDESNVTDRKVDKIRTTANGLTEEATIGVYVTDNLLSTRGIVEKQFGQSGSNEQSNLDAFRNDRSTLVGDAEGNTDHIIWAIAYKLVLDPNGGDGTPVSVVLTSGKEYTLGEPYTKEGFYFAGWNTRKDGSGDSYAPQDVVSHLTKEEGATVTLYAQWEEYEPCFIRFHSNGGSDVPYRTVKPGTKLGLLPISQREHYTFVRWMLLDEDGNELDWSYDMEVTTDLDFYATWQKMIKITFDAKGGIVGEKEREITPGSIGSLPPVEQPVEHKKDYEFVEWYQIDEEGTETKVTDKTEFTEDTTIYARWKVIPRRLRYDTNGGNPPKDPATGNYWYTEYVDDLDTIQNYSIPWLPEVTNHGYELVGWFTSASGGEEKRVGDTVDLREVDALHAQWRKLDWVRITFDSDGGSECQTKEVVKGDKLDNYPEPTKSGYVFDGWYLRGEDGNFVLDDEGKPIEINNQIPINADITVKAKWENMVTVTFDSDGGSACAALTVVRGGKISSYPTSAKTGKKFLGWYMTETLTDPDTGAEIIVIKQPEEEVNSHTVINDDITVKAKWADYVTVTFNYTDLKENGESRITTSQVVKGRSLDRIPSATRTSYQLEGWYPEYHEGQDPEFSGNKLTLDTVINEDCTYYAKWESLIVNETEPLKYSYSIYWKNQSTDTLTNLGDQLAWHVPGSQSGTVQAVAFVYFNLERNEGKTVPENGICLKIPKYVFDKRDDIMIPGEIGENDIVNAIPERPRVRPNFKWNCTEDSSYYYLWNTEEVDSLNLNLTITYEVEIGQVKAARVDADTGKRLDQYGDFIENDDYSPRKNDFGITIEYKKDGEEVLQKVTAGKSLYTAAYKTYTRTSYSAKYNKGTADVYSKWNNSWGAKPADAEKYYYVKWNHGGFSIEKTGDFRGNTSGLLTVTDRNWLPDDYEVVYEDQNGNYVVTRHLYSELTNNRKTLARKEKIDGEWTTDHTKETGIGTITCYVDFHENYVPPTPGGSESATDLYAKKSHYGNYGDQVGQDKLLDGETVSGTFELRMTGPGEENLKQKEGTNLYYPDPYTMIMRDGEKGDLSFYSADQSRNIKLGDNDYRFTKLTFALTNADGYKDDNGKWQKLTNNAYSSWKPVEVWLRRAGKTVYYKYTDIVFNSAKIQSIPVPDDTVGFEIRYSSIYWSSELTVNATVKINPTRHITDLVQQDYDARKDSRIYNSAIFKAVRDDDGEVLKETDPDELKASFALGKAKIGLGVRKWVGTAANDKNNGLQTVLVTTTGYHRTSPDRIKPIYRGMFYELLPLGTAVDQNSIIIKAVETGKVIRLNDPNTATMLNVEFVPEWGGTKQTMMIVSFGMPEEKAYRSSDIALSYTLINTYENVIANGINLYSPSAFVSNNKKLDYYELLPKVKKINEVKDAQSLFSEQEAQYGEHIAYASASPKFLKINAFSSEFSKSVDTLNKNEFKAEAEAIAQTSYVYQLTFGQSANSQSDKLVFYDLLDRGTVEDKKSKYYTTDPDTGEANRKSEWQGKFISINVPKIVSSLNGKECNVKIYYSTTNAEDIKQVTRNLTDTSVWLTNMPADKDSITAIAIDLSKDKDGNDFILNGDDKVTLTITMESPSNVGYDHKISVNTAVAAARTYFRGEPPETEEKAENTSQTIIEMKPVEETIGLASDPVSGTAANPRKMAYDDTLEYDVFVTNPDTQFSYKNIVIKDTISKSVRTDDEGNQHVEEAVSIDEDNIYIYIGDISDKASTEKIKLSNSPRVSVERDENGRIIRGADGSLTFTVKQLYHGETLHIVIPCIVKTKEGVFTNTARLTQINGLTRNNKVSETTYHEVKKYPVEFGKKILETENYLAGAKLALKDSSGDYVDRWTSVAVDDAATAEDDRYHTVKIGAGEYAFTELGAPDNYAEAASIWFTISREGELTLRKQTQPLLERKIDMYDKYIPVDVVISTEVLGRNAETDKLFSYTAYITGLKKNKTYLAVKKNADGTDSLIGLTFKSDSRGEATVSAFANGSSSVPFSLKHGESITLKDIPTGAKVKIRQSEITGEKDYSASYQAELVKREDGGAQTIVQLCSGETYLRNQALMTDEMEADIDRGEEIRIKFKNEHVEGVPVRIIVHDYDDKTPVEGAGLHVKQTSAPKEGEDLLDVDWLSSNNYKRIILPFDSTSELEQLSVPEAYIGMDGKLTLTVNEEEELSCSVSDHAVLTEDKDGYILTVWNKKKAKLIVENIATNTLYYLKGADFELLKIRDKNAPAEGDNLESVKTWTSASDKGEILYLDREQDYIVKKTASPQYYEPVNPVEVRVSVDGDAQITVDAAAEKAKVFDKEKSVLTFVDKYVTTLIIRNIVTWPETQPPAFDYVISGLKAGDEYRYKIGDGEEKTFTADSEGTISFRLEHEQSIMIKDLPDNVTITEIKPSESYYAAKWIRDKVYELDAEDDLEHSVVTAKLTGRNTIVVTNDPFIARVRSREDGEWSDWKYFEELSADDYSGVFDYVNGDDVKGEVVIETMLENHPKYTMSTGFEFDNEDITDLTIRSSQELLTEDGKHSVLVCGTKNTLLTFNTGNPVTVSRLELNGNNQNQTSQNGGAVYAASSEGPVTLSDVTISNFKNAGGAVSAGKDCTVYFEGNTVVFNNTDYYNNQKNVVLDQDSNTVIRVTRNGIGENAYIGVYVTGEANEEPYLSHGDFEDHFATYYPYDPNTDRFDRFVNDRNGMYGEAYFNETSADTTSEKIYEILWQSYLCKVTVHEKDAEGMPTGNDGKLLYTDANGSSPAIYRTLKDGFAATKTTLYYSDGTVYEYSADNAINVEMLRNYTQSKNDRPTVDANRSVTFITANNDVSLNPDQSDIYVYNKGSDETADDERATITRGAKDGSMIYDNSGDLTLINIILDGNRPFNGHAGYIASGDGGIVYAENAVLNISTGAVLRNSMTGDKGGAVSITGNGTLNLTGGTISGNYAIQGGGIHIGGDASFTMEDGIISENTATEFGGGILKWCTQETVMSGGSIIGNSAPLGSGLYLHDDKAFNMSGGSITGNKGVKGTDGGAVNFESDSSRLILSKDAVIYENFEYDGNTATNQQKNVVLNLNTNTVINTGTNGLAEKARIGVYVVGDVDTNPFKEHGTWKLDFGTVQGSNDSKKNLSGFTNDRNGLYGEEDTDNSGLIRWQSYVCKVTDGNDNLLYWKEKGEEVYHPAVYNSVRDAFSATYDAIIDEDENISNSVRQKLYLLDGNSYVKYEEKNYKVKMLVPNYTAVKSIDGNIYYDEGINSNYKNHFGDEKLNHTLTTETDTAKTSMFPYWGEAGTSAAIIRTGAKDSKGKFVFQNNMLTVKNGHSLTIANILLDGNSSIVTSQDEGGMIQIKGGVLTLDSGAILQNSKTAKNGGAVNVTVNQNDPKKTPGKLFMREGSMICNSTCANNKNGGGVIVSTGSFEMTGGTIAGCEADKGGAVYVNGSQSIILSGGLITGNTSRKDGAGIFLTQNSAVYLSGNPAFTGAYINSSNETVEGTGNFKKQTLSGETNGGQAYDKPRQDIFVAGYLGLNNDNITPKNAISIRVIGKVNSGDGSIWVWAEKPAETEPDNHYEQLKQFAWFYNKDNNYGTKLSNTDKVISMQAFRNAQPDSATGCNGTYLTGQFAPSSSSGNLIYWTGMDKNRKVILRKTAKNTDTYESLSGAKFDIYKGSSLLGSYESGENGVFYMGELAYGYYYLFESTAPNGYSSGKWFCLIINSTGNYMSEGKSDRDQARADAEALLQNH